jgi:transglutaminase-like putative cysteine protease
MMVAQRRLLLFLALCAAARADRPPDWLILPASGDPRPQGCSSWVLYDQQRVKQEKDGSTLARYRQAVMLLTESGAKGAIFYRPYTAGSSSVVFARAWAMSPDGKKCREFGGADFYVFSMTVSNQAWDQQKVEFFNPTRFLEPGWVFAWEVEIKSDTAPFDFPWDPRRNIPVREASLELVPAEDGSIKWESPLKEIPPPARGPGGSLTWSVSNLPGFDVDVPPALNRTGSELRAYMVQGGDHTQTWADVVRLARAQMDPKAVATPAIQSIANREAAPGGLWSRIEPVCRFVQKQVSYLQVTIDSDSMAGYRPHSAGEVCDNRYGDCKDKATLLCTMLGTLGVEAHVMIVNSGSPMTNRMEWPSAFFNHAIVAIFCREAPPEGSTVVRVSGRDYLLFDPTNDFVRFGLLPMEDVGGLGLILAPGVDSAVTIPFLPADTVTTSSTIKTVIAEDGSATVDAKEDRFSLAAAVAAYQGETMRRADRTSALERRIQGRLPLISDLSWDSSDNPADHSWSTKVHFTAQSVAKRMTGGYYVTADLMSVVPFAKPWDGQTEGWVTIVPGTLVRDVEIDAPAGWDFSAMPEDWNFSSPAGAGRMHYTRSGSSVTGEVRLKINGGVLDRKAYLEYRELLSAAMAAEHEPLVLHRPPPKAAPAAPKPAADLAPAQATGSQPGS